ncbi:MAG: response regulator transcription factor [Asticcacaulis sp.]
MKLLIVEDDSQTADFIMRGLTQSGHTTDAAEDGRSGYELALHHNYDVLIIDRMLPKMSGLEFVRSLRAEGRTTPVLLLTALASVDERVEGLEAGADDYLGKPFAFTELLARVKALHRRNKSNGVDGGHLIQIADLSIDLQKRRVTRETQRIDLTPQEYKLLEFLARRAGETVTRTMLLENLWGYDFDPRTNIVEAHMSRLRAKIDRGSGKSLLRTLRGVGYVLDDPA